MRPKKHVLDGGQDHKNPFAAARSDKTEMWLLLNYFEHLLLLLLSLLLLPSPSSVLK